ncbi:MAG: hypothetical protein ABIA67_01410 [Candidatus Margulisiibacteriota bacterium]
MTVRFVSFSRFQNKDQETIKKEIRDNCRDYEQVDFAGLEGEDPIAVIQSA